MKITGKEKASLCIEIDNKEEWTNQNYTIEQLLDSYILGSIAAPIKSNNKIETKTVKYFSIGDTIIDKRTRINAKFRASLKYPKDKESAIDFECVCTYLDISDLYNFIVDLYIDYAEGFNVSITDINLKIIEIQIRYPISFTDKGFINSKVLTQYDLDGQIDILLYFLKTQKWEIINNKVIFTELINDEFVCTLLKVFEKEAIINNEKHRNIIINYCESLGITTARKNAENKIQKEQVEKERLEKIINDNQEFYSLNLTKYNPKFTNRITRNSKRIIFR